MQSFALEHLNEADKATQRILKDSALQVTLYKLAGVYVNALLLKGRIPLAENGGDAADDQYFSGE